MMDPNTKEFHEITEEKAKATPTPGDGPIFRVGERFTLNGVEMSVRKITRKDVLLRPVK